MRDSLVSLERLEAPTNAYPSDYLRKLGVRLRSSASVSHMRSSRSLSALSCLSQPLVARQSAEYRRPQNSAHFIQDIVIPAKLHTYERSLGPSYSSDFGRTQPSQCGKQSQFSVRTASTSLQPYMNSTDASRSANSVNNKRRQSNKSRQAIRYENEQVDRAQTRLLKQASEVMSHRVDRLYYMSGRSLNVNDRYKVNEDELHQLRRLAMNRKENAEYGRRLRDSRMSSKYMTEKAVPIPQQPPPSSMSGANVSLCATPMPPEAITRTAATPDHKIAPPVNQLDNGPTSLSVHVGTLEMPSAIPDRQGAQRSDVQTASDVSAPLDRSQEVWPCEVDTVETSADNTQTFLTQAENCGNTIGQPTDKQLEEAARHITIQD